jgi:hypothetical protein
MKRAESVVRILRYSMLKDIDGGHFVLKAAVEFGIADDIQV